MVNLLKQKTNKENENSVLKLKNEIRELCAEYKIKPKDTKTGEMYYKKILKKALKNNAYYTFLVSNCYATGNYVDKNEEIQMIWLEKSLKDGSQKAKYRLAKIYLENEKYKDEEKGKKFLIDLANKRYIPAIKALEKIENKSAMKGKIDELTIKADKGDIEALYSLGHYYTSGYQTKDNIEKAKVYLSNAARNGHDKAQCELGLLYLRETSNISFKQKGIELLEASAKQGNEFAIKALTTIDFYIAPNFRYAEKQAKEEIISK